MKLLFIFIFIPFLSFSTSKEITKDTVKAQYVGGSSEMNKFIVQNFKLPKEWNKSNVVGSISVMFTVSKEGIIQNLNILKSPDLGLDTEILRIFELMPKWIPAKFENKLVNSQVNLTFYLHLGR